MYGIPLAARLRKVATLDREREKPTHEIKTGAERSAECNIGAIATMDRQQIHSRTLVNSSHHDNTSTLVVEAEPPEFQG